MAETIRLALSAVAVKVETTAGVDAFGGGTPALSDFIAASMTVELPQQAVEDDSQTGSFDRNAPIPTGIRPAITLTFRMRGTGVPGAAPEWGKLLTACRFEEILQATAVGAPTSATAGSARTATLGTPFAATDQVYRGMPILLSGNPSVARASLVQDYTAGRVATFPEVFDPPLSTATQAQVPVNALYRLTDDPDLIRPVTIYGYRGNMLWKFVGCVGAPSWQLQAGQPGDMTVAMRGQLIGQPVSLAPPAGWNAIKRQQAPIWARGLSRLDGALARCARYSWGSNNTMYDGENPEAPEGFDPPELTGAAPRIEIDPFSTSTLSPGRFSKLRTGDSASFAAILGTVPGNRIGITHPSNRVTSFGLGARGEKGTDQIQLTPDVPGQGTFITVF